MSKNIIFIIIIASSITLEIKLNLLNFYFPITSSCVFYIAIKKTISAFSIIILSIPFILLDQYLNAHSTLMIFPLIIFTAFLWKKFIGTHPSYTMIIALCFIFFIHFFFLGFSGLFPYFFHYWHTYLLGCTLVTIISPILFWGFDNCINLLKNY